MGLGNCIFVKLPFFLLYLISPSPSVPNHISPFVSMQAVMIWLVGSEPFDAVKEMLPLLGLGIQTKNAPI